MLATLLSILGGGFGGGLLRLLPEVLAFFGKKEDNAHELNMLNAQITLEQTKGAEQRASAQVQGQIDEALAQMKSADAARAGQGQPLTFQLVGSKIIDGFDALVTTCVNALNMLVRPLTTYYFLALYGLYKYALLMAAMRQTDIWSAILQVYTKEDAAMLSGLMTFWFVGRVFDKAAAR